MKTPNPADQLMGEAAVEQLPADQDAFLRLVLAAGLGLLIAGVARIGRPRTTRSDRDLTSTLVLLPTLVALVSLVINGSLARAFSLVGALAVVRFRSAVEDARDTAFVIYSVGAGMAAGTGVWHYPLMAAPIVAVLTYLMRPRTNGRGTPVEVTVRLEPGVAPAAAVGPTLAAFLKHCEEIEAGTARKGDAFEVVYHGELLAGRQVADFAAELGHLDGVTEVEVQRKKD